MLKSCDDKINIWWEQLHGLERDLKVNSLQNVNELKC